jgi:hypothetical protein
MQVSPVARLPCVAEGDGVRRDKGCVLPPGGWRAAAQVPYEQVPSASRLTVMDSTAAVAISFLIMESLPPDLAAGAQQSLVVLW